MSICVKKGLGGMIAVLLGATSAHAGLVNIANPNNLLAGLTTTATDGPSTIDPGIAFGPATPAVTDNLATDTTSDAAFIFNVGPTALNPNDLNISGITAPNGFDDVRIFIAPVDGQRVPTQVTVFTSTTNTTSTDPTAAAFAGAGGTSYGTFNVPATFKPYSPDDPTGTQRGYFDLTIPAHSGTQSLLLQFTGTTTGTRVYEVQALLPEPASMSLLGLGALSMLARRRRA